DAAARSSAADPAPFAGFCASHTIGTTKSRPDRTDVVYLIQHRSPWGRVLSEIDRQTKLGKPRWDDREFAARWLLTEAQYVLRFYRKWLRRPPQSAIVLAYEDLITDPATAVEIVLDRLGVSVGREAIDIKIAPIAGYLAVPRELNHRIGFRR